MRGFLTVGNSFFGRHLLLSLERRGLVFSAPRSRPIVPSAFTLCSLVRRERLTKNNGAVILLFLLIAKSKTSTGQQESGPTHETRRRVVPSCFAAWGSTEQYEASRTVAAEAKPGQVPSRVGQRSHITKQMTTIQTRERRATRERQLDTHIYRVPQPAALDSPLQRQAARYVGQIDLHEAKKHPRCTRVSMRRSHSSMAL